MQARKISRRWWGDIRLVYEWFTLHLALLPESRSCIHRRRKVETEWSPAARELYGYPTCAMTDCLFGCLCSHPTNVWYAPLHRSSLVHAARLTPFPSSPRPNPIYHFFYDDRENIQPNPRLFHLMSQQQHFNLIHYILQGSSLAPFIAAHYHTQVPWSELFTCSRCSLRGLIRPIRIGRWVRYCIAICKGLVLGLNGWTGGMHLPLLCMGILTMIDTNKWVCPLA